MTFSIPLKKQNINGKLVTYNLKFIDTARFMNGSLSSHVNFLSELLDCKCEDKKDQVINIKHKTNMIHSKCKTCHKRLKQPLQLLKDKLRNTSTMQQQH